MAAISFSIFSIYLVYILNTVGIRKLSSLSESYYYTGWMFQVGLFSSAALLVPVLLEITPEPFKALAYFTASPVLFVSAAPKFKNKTLERKVHILSAGISAAFSLFWAVLMFEPTYLNTGVFIFALITFFFLFKKHGQPVFFAELFCFLMVYLTIAMKF